MENNEYYQEMQGWDWEGFKRDTLQSALETLADCSVEELANDDNLYQDDSGFIGRVFLGTVFNLTPSGKYYQPFACGNVEECETCGGDGEIDNPKENHELSTLYTCKASKLTNELLSTYGAWCNGNWPADKAEELNHYREHVKEFAPTKVCPDCNGLGSSEAYQDQLYNETLEQIADEHGFWQESGEGDPCDMFLARWVSREEIVLALLEGYQDTVKSWLDSKGTIREIKRVDRETRSVLNKLNELGA